MATREEIREGIDRDIEFVLMAAYHAGKTGESISEAIDKCTSHLKKALHSRGVVIKVDRELPKLKDVRLYGGGNLDFEHGYESGWNRHKTEVRQAGYEAIVLLIKE